MVSSSEEASAQHSTLTEDSPLRIGMTHFRNQCGSLFSSIIVRTTPTGIHLFVLLLNIGNMLSTPRGLIVFVILFCQSGSWAFVVNPASVGRSSVISGPKGSNVVTENEFLAKGALECLAKTMLGVAIAATLAVPNSAFADGQTKKFSLPPIDYSDTNRCLLKSSSIGQANAARDKLYDLRKCELSGAQASGFDLSGVIMTETDVSKANFEEAYFSKGYLRDSNFDGADFTNAIVDRATFQGSSLRGTIFKNTVLTGTSFEGADVEGADFTEAALGSFDLRGLCKNPTLKGENPKTGASTRETVGCDPS